jgi:sugar phosphate isomerase/epimerase
MTQPQLSIQLYTVNDQLVADPDGTLARLAALGIRQVEAFAFVDRAEALAESFAKHGLQAKTGHAPVASEEIRRGDVVIPVPPVADVFAAAKTLGLEYVIDPFVPIERWLDAEQIEATATRLNEVAKQATEHGLKVGYHNHAQEFVADIDGVNGFEYFASLLDDDVIIELDLFWAATAGQDVVALLGRLGDKVKALHIKDGVIGENPFVVGAPILDKTELDQRPAGQGEVPLLEAIQASPSTEFAVIEFDYVPGDIFDAVQGSAEFLISNGIK